ncbi:hypothetical protein FHG87_016815 [Trinorchestia longiramus]|nr:hypothetical protein FHG87_016815 [Trinorchestia longiramus]
MNTNSLQQHVNEPTRGNNILDLVMTTTDLSINGLEVTDKIGDHQMIDFSLEVQDPNTRTQHKQVFDYKRANFELMKEELGSSNYEVLMNNKNAEECYMILKDKIANATDHHIQRKRFRPTNNPPWFSQEIKRLINARQHSYRRLKRYQTEPHRQEHIHACRAFTSLTFARSPAEFVVESDQRLIEASLTEAELERWCSHGFCSSVEQMFGFEGISRSFYDFWPLAGGGSSFTGKCSSMKSFFFAETVYSSLGEFFSSWI